MKSRFYGALLMAALAGELSFAAPPAELPNLPCLFVDTAWDEGYVRASGLRSAECTTPGVVDKLELDCVVPLPSSLSPKRR